MTLALLIAGIVALVAGVLSILFGLSVREFTLGSPLIISGTIGVCSGMLLVGLYAVVLELKAIASRLAGGIAPSEVRIRPVLPGLESPGAATPEPKLGAGPRIEPASPPAAPAVPPWQSEVAARERPPVEAPKELEVPAPPVPEAPRRRNLMFASTSRKERERAEAKGGEPAPATKPESEEVPGAPATSFEDAWPKTERARAPEPPPPMRRPPPRPLSSSPEAAPPAPPPEPAPPPPPAEQPPVTVLKSGVVDGMAYSLYSDGSIEAQMPEGMMRFASIDELRTHLDQRS